MTAQSATTIDLYLPAGFQPSSVPGPVERLLKAPFRRQAAIWLSDE